VLISPVTTRSSSAASVSNSGGTPPAAPAVAVRGTRAVARCRRGPAFDAAPGLIGGGDDRRSGGDEPGMRFGVGGGDWLGMAASRVVVSAGIGWQPEIDISASITLSTPICLHSETHQRRVCRGSDCA
jgi:hypothetical protein